MTNSTIAGELEIRSNETDADSQRIKNEIITIMRGTEDKKSSTQVTWDFTTDCDIERVFHNDNQNPHPVGANDNDEPNMIRLAS